MYERFTLLRPRAAGFALAALVLCSPALLRGQEPTKNNPKVLKAFRDVVARANPAVVRIQSDGKDVALGTVVDPDGLVLTKSSQLGDKLSVKLGDRTFDAQVIGVENANDLALLKVDARGLTAVAWRPAKEATPGDWVATAGTEKEPLAVGVVSVPVRHMTRRNYPPATNPNSGFLGINLDQGDGGVKVGGVQANTGAAKAGLKVGDIIVAIDSKPIPDPETLMNTIARYKPNDTITLKIKREDKEQDIKATLGKRPADLSRGDLQNSMGSELSKRRTGFPDILQHDTILKPADCGGPLVDLDGKVIGINIARAGRTESYAIPSEIVLALLPDLKSGKLAPTLVKDPTKGKFEKEEAAVREAQEKLSVAEGKAASLKKLLEQTKETAQTVGKKDAELAEVLKRVQEAVERADRQVAEARKPLEKAKADLEKARKGAKTEK